MDVVNDILSNSLQPPDWTILFNFPKNSETKIKGISEATREKNYHKFFHTEKKLLKVFCNLKSKYQMSFT